MKTILILIINLLFLNTATFSFSDWDGRHTREKTIKKSFNVDAHALLKINNSYGNINVITYPGKTVDIEVKIKTNGNDLEKVQQKLEDIKIEFQGTINQVTAITDFSKTKSNGWWSWARNNNVNMEVNYIIKLPITNNVNLNNSYGNINLDRLEGDATLNCDYGKITTKELFGANNYLTFDYSTGCYFDYIENGKINADYSGFTVAKSKLLQITADYSNSKVEIAENVNYNCDYGSITVEKANTIKGNGDYLTARFGEVFKNLEINANYGSVKIENLNASTSTVTINSDYTSITVGYAYNFHFNFDIRLDYASLRDADNFEFTKKNIESTNKYYHGYYGNSNTTNTIKITSDYGSVTFKQN